MTQTTATDIKTFRDELRKHKLRFTQVRRAIFTALNDSDSPLTIQEVIAQVPNGHFVSVYRSLDALYDAGLVRQIPQGFKSLYELNDQFKDHHHHLTCTNCGISVEIVDHTLETHMNALTHQYGFTPTEHQFELFGVCSKCQ